MNTVTEMIKIDHTDNETVAMPRMPFHSVFFFKIPPDAPILSCTAIRFEAAFKKNLSNIICTSNAYWHSCTVFRNFLGLEVYK